MSHYFENDEELVHNEHIINVKIKNIYFDFYVDNGVFSKNKLDYGTRVLLETLDTKEINGNVLDFGCGYGPIGIFLAKTTFAQIDMVDINKNALSLAIKNLKLNNLNATVFESNIYSNINKKYDYIISNPPIRVGKKILYQILFEAKKHLNKNGKLWIVINKDQGAKTVVRDLSNDYNVEIKNKSKGFYIICATSN